MRLFFSRKTPCPTTSGVSPVLFTTVIYLLLLMSSDIYAQSILSLNQDLIVSRKGLLNPASNTSLKEIIPEPDNSGKYEITEKTLKLIHRLNLNGQNSIAREIFNNLKGSKEKKIPSGNLSQQPNEAVQAVIESDKLNNQGADNALTNYYESVKNLPVTNDKTLDEYIEFLKTENEYFLGNYRYVYFAAENLFLKEIPKAIGKDLIYYYAESVLKLRWPTSIVPKRATEYIFENDNDTRITTILINLTIGCFSTVNFDDAYYYLENINTPVTTEQLKLVRNSYRTNLDASFFERIYDAPQDVNLKAVLFIHYAELVRHSDDKQRLESQTGILARVDNPYVQSLVNEFRTSRQVSKSFKSHKIGVLLPFSYKKFSKLVADVVSGLLMALDQSAEKYELIMEDTGLNQAKTEKAARKLILEDQVAAIIGPMSKLNSVQAASVADQYKVPVISLSQTPKIGEGHEFFYRMHNNSELNQDALIAYVTDYLNIHNLNVAYNPIKTNEKKLSSLSSIITSNNGKITNLYKIDPAKKDFRKLFEEITGKILYGENKVENNDSFETLLSSDGIMLMVQPSQFLGMASYFKTYGLNTYKIMTAGWDPELIYAKDIHNQLIFTGEFFQNDDPELVKFYFDYWKKLGYNKQYASPSAYVYYAYSALKLLTVALNDKANSRESLNELLKNKTFIQNTLPEFTYNGDGEINRQVNVYRINEQSKVTPIF